LEDFVSDKDSSHLIHIATLDKGKIIFNLKTRKFNFNENLIDKNQSGYLNLFYDKENNLWQGSTSGLELIASNAGKFNIKKIFSEGKTIDHLLCIEEDSENNIAYLASYSRGIWIWNKNTESFKPLDAIDISKTGVIFDLFLENSWWLEAPA
jgi:ligand-binding sensor domain-containing protein